jgi:hypothetical protein
MTVRIITPFHKLSTNMNYLINVSNVEGNSEEKLKIYPNLPFFSGHVTRN